MMKRLGSGLVVLSVLLAGSGLEAGSVQITRQAPDALLAGKSITVAEDNNTLSPAVGTFTTSTVSYTYDSGDAGLAGLAGEVLEIRLLNLAADPEGVGTSGPGFTVDFDNATFSSAPNSN